MMAKDGEVACRLQLSGASNHLLWERNLHKVTDDVIKAQFNVQKNQGYELTHNYGHGKQTLSMVFYLLHLLAFIAHMILDRGDRLYQRGVATSSRRELWHTLRTAMSMILVSSWSQILLIYLEEDHPGP